MPHTLISASSAGDKMKIYIYCDICHPGIVEAEVASIEEAFELASGDFSMDDVDCRITDEQGGCLLIRPTGTVLDEHMTEIRRPTAPGPWRGDACYCQDCLWEGEEADCNSIDDIFERVAPGEPMPCGQCPLCGALCQLK